MEKLIEVKESLSVMIERRGQNNIVKYSNSSQVIQLY